MTSTDIPDEKQPRKGRGVLVFLVGFFLGAVLAIVARPFLGERLPQAVGGKKESVGGLVTAKQLQGDRLLLTINTSSGAVLSTFGKRVEEINLLVETGDTVTLTIPGYQPFLDDPEITRVVKPTRLPGAEGMEADVGGGEPADSSIVPGDTLQPADSAVSGPASRWY